MIYLDNSSTTKPYDEVVKETASAMSECFGNPSSLHGLGIDAEKKIKTARQNAADAIGADPGEIFFNSGGTEGDNTAVIGAANARKRYGNRVITSKIEHPAVLESFDYLEKQGFEVIRIGCNSNGSIDLAELEDAVNGETILVSIMHVNNETGSVNDIGYISEIKNNAILHTDAVQSFGKVPVSCEILGADMITVSGHKVHGPKGTGFMYLKKGINIPPYIMGGGQEKAFRSGTENVPGISGLGIACKRVSDNMESRTKSMSSVREYLLNGIKDIIPDIRINSPENGCPSVLNVSFLGTRGEVILHMLEDIGIYVSTGSACASNKKGQSYVLKEIGLTDKEIEGAIRFSFSEFNTVKEMDFVIESLSTVIKRFRRLGTFR